MASTEETVRDAIVGAIRGIAVSQLGFDVANGNVKDYLLEFEEDTKAAEFLKAVVGGEPAVRCWAVDVLGNDPWFATGDITKREYTITIEAYYAIGVDGTGAKALVTAARKVRNAIRGLGSRLSGTVDLVSSVGELTRRRASGYDADQGQILIGRMVYTAQKVAPDW